MVKLIDKYELTPNDGKKSFYGKAMVEVDCYGAEVLRSYGTAVIRREPDGKLIPLWEGWSATTGRHIKAFCGLNKAEYQAL